VLDRLLLALRSLLTPPAVWRWAIINLMGRQVLHGLVKGADRPVFHVRELRPDGTWHEHVHTRPALWGVEYAEEQVVRQAIVQSGTEYTCSGWRSSPVLPDRCASCGEVEAEHQRQAERDALDEARVEVISNLRQAVALSGVRVSMWSPGAPPVVLAAHTGDHPNARALTREEWAAAWTAGVPMGPYPTLPEPRDSDPPGVSA
jgi:hypothetical protein